LEGSIQQLVVEPQVGVTASTAIIVKMTISVTPVLTVLLHNTYMWQRIFLDLTISHICLVVCA